MNTGLHIGRILGETGSHKYIQSIQEMHRSWSQRVMMKYDQMAADEFLDISLHLNGQKLNIAVVGYASFVYQNLSLMTNNSVHATFHLCET